MDKSSFLILAVAVAGLMRVTSVCGAGQNSDGARQVLELLPSAWRLNPKQPELSSLSTQNPQADLAAPANATNGFTIKLAVNLRKFAHEKSLVEIPNVLYVSLRQHSSSDRARQNYPAYPMPDASVPVLEATLSLHSVEHPNWTNMTIGFPLAMLAKPDGPHEVVLHFAGADWKVYVDGELLDNDFPFGYPHWPERSVWRLDPEFVTHAILYGPGIQPERSGPPISRPVSAMQYWVPRGHNSWVGDVQTCYFQGRYHVFYLFDRRHHQSKFGCGAHYFEHLSTKDFHTWTEHEAATPLEEQWECIGTGVPFVFKDQLCLAYGLHTTRVYPAEKTTLPAQWAYLNKNGRTGSFKESSTPGVPAGSTYAMSADGVSHFRKSHIMFHPCENPSVYNDPNGQLRLLANYRSSGTWESASPDGGWQCLNRGFPPGGDCTIFFRWGRFDYIAGGFTGLWFKPADAPESAYADLVSQGLDFYDGSNVPAITAIPGGRFVMAAWVPIRGWGGPLILRELEQFSDGRMGTKWMPEVMPETEQQPTVTTATIGNGTSLPADTTSFLLAFEVEPAEAKGRFALSFLPEQGEQAGCELQISLNDQRAQFGPASLQDFGPRQKSLREGGAPHHADNYAIENLVGTDKPFRVRVLVKNTAKIGGSLIDVEIAGKRTLISYRPDLAVQRIIFRVAAAELRNLEVRPLRPET
jgi:hypothetical protein